MICKAVANPRYFGHITKADQYNDPMRAMMIEFGDSGFLFCGNCTSGREPDKSIEAPPLKPITEGYSPSYVGPLTRFVWAIKSFFRDNFPRPPALAP